jgi:hypothetical protein
VRMAGLKVAELAFQSNGEFGANCDVTQHNRTFTRLCIPRCTLSPRAVESDKRAARNYEHRTGIYVRSLGLAFVF